MKTPRNLLLPNINQHTGGLPSQLIRDINHNHSISLYPDTSECGHRNKYYHSSPGIDYSIEHAKEIADATAEMAVTTVKPTGQPLSLALVTAILEGKPSHLITLLGTQPDGVVNDRLNGKADGITPLHLAATLYANMRRYHRDLEAMRYDTICRILLQAGADPLARAYHPNDSTSYYPSEFADGLTPPSLRRRMLLEAANDHLGWQVERSLPSIRQNTQATLERRERRAGGRP